MGEAIKTPVPAGTPKADPNSPAAVNPHDAFFLKWAEIFPGSIVFRDASEIDNQPDPAWRPSRRLQTVAEGEARDAQRRPGAPSQSAKR